MGISFGGMNKVFISHLHADHKSDLSAICCFGPANDRRSRLYVCDSAPSGVWSPNISGRPYDDGTRYRFPACVSNAGSRWMHIRSNQVAISPALFPNRAEASRHHRAREGGLRRSISATIRNYFILDRQTDFSYDSSICSVP